MQPYHELHPSQAAIFGLVPRFVTLREDRGAGTWRLDRAELRAALSDPAVRAVVVNTPQNPTGKVLDEDDLGFIAELCRTYDRFAITDEIYGILVPP
jgi:N-succinyldiaminopimelate aminotransferase